MACLKSQQEKVPWVSIFEMNDKTIRLYNKQTSRFEVHCSSLDINLLFFVFEHCDAVSARFEVSSRISYCQVNNVLINPKSVYGLNFIHKRIARFMITKLA